MLHTRRAAWSRPASCENWEEEVRRFEERHGDLDTLEVILPDSNGVLRGKWLPGSALRKVFESGVALPFSLFGLDVWGREVEETGMHIETGDKDGVCWPVPGTLNLVPWMDRRRPRFCCPCTIATARPSFATRVTCWRGCATKLAEHGLSATAAFELEFYLFEDQDDGDWSGAPTPVFATHLGPARQNMYALSDLEALMGVVDELRRSADAQGIPADAAVSEAAPGQFELNLHYRRDPLLAAR